jgi:tRNA threonylcarbamoyladenosine biosynthesis protein TsaE
MPEGTPLVVRTTSADETEARGRALGMLLTGGDVVALSGDLGAGKTVMVRGIVAGTGSAARVASPTFTLIREYAGPRPLFHVDLYRLDSPQQLDDIGLDEVFARGGIVLIEWAERAGPYLPDEHLWIAITFRTGEDERELTFTARGRRYAEILADLTRSGSGRRR